MDSLKYLLLINLYLVLFFAFYSAVLRNETFFKLNRTYLVSGALLSFLIPMIQSEWVKSFFITRQITQSITYAVNLPVFIVKQKEEALTISEIIMIVYMAGVCLFLIRFLYQLSLVNRALKKSDGRQAFSFFGKIIVDPTLPNQDILVKHEMVHARQWHSADIIFFELIAIFNWFNPIVYLYKKTIKYIHEFTADEIATANEYTKTEYAMLLLSNVFGVQTHEFTNNFFNHSLLKRRIIMLNKTKSNQMALLKYGLSIPLFAIMLIFSSATVKQKIEKMKSISDLKLTVLHSSVPIVENITTIVSKPLTVSKLVSVSSPEETNQDTIASFAEIDILPEFPGGSAGWGKYLLSTLKYPAEARINKISGRVFISFVVETDGTLNNVKVLKGIGSSCDEEAVRVVKNSPKWKPGIQKGKVVRVAYTTPIAFELGNKTGKVPKASSVPKNVLMLLDGVEITPEEMKKLDAGTIDSINVIKDAVLLAQYGDKGKDGVVLIITKKK